MATTMQRHIEVGADVRKRIMQELDISEGGLSLALNYKRDGEDAKKARALALELGGEVVYSGDVAGLAGAGGAAGGPGFRALKGYLRPVTAR